jgi:hypothetical protein
MRRVGFVLARMAYRTPASLGAPGRSVRGGLLPRRQLWVAQRVECVAVSNTNALASFCFTDYRREGRACSDRPVSNGCSVVRNGTQIWDVRSRRSAGRFGWAIER